MFESIVGNGLFWLACGAPEDAKSRLVFSWRRRRLTLTPGRGDQGQDTIMPYGASFRPPSMKP